MAKILIIDDELDLLSLMDRILEDRDHDVTSVYNGRDVLEGLVGSDFDLVITDMIMPGVDGLEVLAHLAQLNPHIKVIAISGGGYFTPDFLLDLAAKFGAVSTLEKPFQRSEFVATVDRVLSRGAGRHDPDTQSATDANRVDHPVSGDPPSDSEFGSFQDDFRSVVRILLRRGARNLSIGRT